VCIVVSYLLGVWDNLVTTNLSKARVTRDGHRWATIWEISVQRTQITMPFETEFWRLRKEDVLLELRRSKLIWLKSTFYAVNFIDYSGASGGAIFTFHTSRFLYRSKSHPQVQKHFSIIISLQEFLLPLTSFAMELFAQGHCRSTISELLPESSAAGHSSSLCTLHCHDIPLGVCQLRSRTRTRVLAYL